MPLKTMEWHARPGPGMMMTPARNNKSRPGTHDEDNKGGDNEHQHWDQNHNQKKRKMTWHPPHAYELLLIGWIVGAMDGLRTPQ